MRYITIDIGGLEPQIRPTSLTCRLRTVESDASPLNIVLATHIIVHEGMEVVRGNGNVHWTSHTR